MNKYTDFTSRVKSPDIGKSNSKLLDYNSNCLSLRLKMARSVNDFETAPNLAWYKFIITGT